MHERIVADNLPLISVIINNYNYGRYLEEAIESALFQTFTEGKVELIVVDDGSSDDTQERVKKYAGKILYIAKENGGQASALNAGIAHSRGRIIAFLDADDYWHPPKLDVVYREFEKSEEIDFVYHFMNVVDDTGNVIDRYVYPNPPSGKNQFLERYLRGNLPWFAPTSGMTVRADCLRKACPIPGDFRIGADLYLHYILPFYARGISLIRKPLGSYRLHGNNLSGGNLLSPDKIYREIRMLFIIKERVKECAEEKGCDVRLVVQRLEAAMTWYEILLDVLSQKKHKALRRIIHFDRFLPGDTFFYRCYKKSAMIANLVFSPSFCLRMQRWYRRLWYYACHEV